MPKTKLQEVVFTILMVFVMVYAMICYNIALNMGGMSNIVFLNAFHELVIMEPIAFILDFFLYGSLSKKLAFRIVTPGVDKPIMISNFIHHRMSDVSNHELFCYFII